MVKALLTRFRRDEDGISLTEGLIVFPLMVLVISAMIEFSYAMYQWNQAVKAVQMGARKAAVSCPLTSDFNAVFAFNAALGGQLISADGSKVSRCGYGMPKQCDDARITALVDGPASNPENFAWKGMRRYLNRDGFDKDNVVVIYEQSGLGYHGRPSGPVVSVRLELRNLTFDLPVVGALLSLPDITVPSFPVSVSTEDLRSGPNDDCS
jgi:Flp pilus assembly pilin Flp